MFAGVVTGRRAKWEYCYIVKMRNESGCFFSQAQGFYEVRLATMGGYKVILKSENWDDADHPEKRKKKYKDMENQFSNLISKLGKDEWQPCRPLPIQEGKLDSKVVFSLMRPLSPNE